MTKFQEWWKQYEARMLLASPGCLYKGPALDAWNAAIEAAFEEAVCHPDCGLGGHSYMCSKNNIKDLKETTE